MLEFFDKAYTPLSTMADFLSYVNKPKQLRANLAVASFFRTALPKDILLADYFSNKVRAVTVGADAYDIEPYIEPATPPPVPPPPATNSSKPTSPPTAQSTPPPEPALVVQFAALFLVAGFLSFLVPSKSKKKE